MVFLNHHRDADSVLDADTGEQAGKTLPSLEILWSGLETKTRNEEIQEIR